MPLLHKAPFVRHPPPAGLRSNDEVFHCKITGEVFDNYDLLWTCSLTGRLNLTFQEALHSEKRAQEQLDSIPESLRIPLAYLAHLTRRSQFKDLVDDVYLFLKDRYFIGEYVTVESLDGRMSCKIVQVISPSEDRTAMMKCKGDDSDSDVICLDDDDDDDDDDDEMQSPSKKIKMLDSREKVDENKGALPVFGPDPELFRYLVQDPKDSRLFAVNAKDICRKKNIFNREKCKLFLKHHCGVEEDGPWKVKAEYVSKFHLSTLTFSNLFAGSLPSFKESEVKESEVKGSETNKRCPSTKVASDIEPQTKVIDLTEDDDMLLHTDDEFDEWKGELPDKKSSAAPSDETEMKNKQTAEQLNIDEELRRMRQEIAECARKREEEKLERQKEKELKKEELKNRADQNRQKRKEELEKKRLERKRQDALLREWNRPREDLECEDLKVLPTPTPVSCLIPPECFGDAVQVLEYLLCFQAVFNFNLPKNITIDVLAKSLTEVAIDGLYADIVQELMTTIFRLQDEEDREEATDDKDMKGLLDGLEEFEDEIIKDRIKSATLASRWPIVDYGTPLRKLHVDSYTLTEIVRLHLLSSGSLIGVNSKYDYQQRGGYTSRDDPGLVFCQQEAKIIQHLGRGNIFDMCCSDKLKIITVLIHQLLTFVLSREVIDENFEKLKQVRRSLRHLQWDKQRRDKAETHYRWKKKLEERQQQAMGIKPSEESMAVKNVAEDRRSSGNQSKEPELVEVSEDMDCDDMPTENIDWDKITPKERARMRERFERKEKELIDLAAELQHAHSISPLGRDRAFRCFWVFRSIPGLFVEDNGDHIPTEYFHGVSENLVGKSVVKDCSSDVSGRGKSNKENVPDAFNDQSICVINCNRMKKVATDCDNTSSFISDSSVNPATKVKWAFYSSADEIDSLIESLNSRGLREGVLRTALMEQKDRLKKWLSKCNSQVLQNANEELGGNVEDERVYLRSRQFPSATRHASAQESLERNLREMLLDLEERIYSGSLGCLKVKDRMEWRVAVDNGRYEHQTGAAMVGSYPVCHSGLSCDRQLRIDDPIDLDESLIEKSSIIVHGLAKALVQVEQMVELRYLDSPLGKDVTKKSRQKVIMDSVIRTSKRELDAKINSSSLDSDEDDHSSASSHHRTALERWEESLISSSSLAQIFLHLTVLESSISWSKSALHARCRICRRKGDGERMLLCDGCNRGHHMYCLKPPVKHVPTGDWFCPACRPKDVLRSSRKKKNLLDEDSGESEENELSDSSEDEEKSISSEVSSDRGEMEEDGDGFGCRSSSEEALEDDDNSDDHSDSKMVIKPAVKIKLFKNAYHLRNPPLQATASSVSQRKTRLRTSAGNSKASSVQETQPLSETKRASEPVNGRSKFGFFQTFSPGTQMATSGCNSHPKQLGLEKEAFHLETNAFPSSSGSKRSRLSLVEESLNSYTTLHSEQLRVYDSAEQNNLTTKIHDQEQQSVMKTCEDLVNELMQRDEAWPFLKPVTRQKAPDYFDIIKKPMDLSVIRNKVKCFEYSLPVEILDDIRLIFSNFKEYSMPTAPEYAAGQKLESYFEKRFRELKLKSASTTPGKSGSPKGRISPRKLRKRAL